MAHHIFYIYSNKFEIFPCVFKTYFKMSYLALARKWRPRFFDQVVGQQHIVQALTNSLKLKRIHHAWLFSGTRGVGKTSFARILSKSLNCEVDITPIPCGKCRSCIEIDKGCFIDYLELDAASNRSVEEMTKLLDNVSYLPSIGRYKIYVIDEVHMLSGHAFNAMLKILEEPPKHVKFILATTEINKIPITILSRCLQFNLKKIPIKLIFNFLSKIFDNESILYEPESLEIISKNANGSLRDALSISDQVISYMGTKSLTKNMVYDLLGIAEDEVIVKILKYILSNDLKSILNLSDEINIRSLSFHAILSNFLTLISRIAVFKETSANFEDSIFSIDDLKLFADNMHDDLIQLFYAILINSLDELKFAPTEYSGFIMICLRLLSIIKENNQNEYTNDFYNNQPLHKENSLHSGIDYNQKNIYELSINNWPNIINNLNLDGLALELAKQSEFISFKNQTVNIMTEMKTFVNKESIAKLESALNEYFNDRITLEVSFGKTQITSFLIQQNYENNLLKQTEKSILENDYVQNLILQLDSKIVENSIKNIKN